MDLVEIVLTEFLAPAEKTPVCLRKDFLKAPDWRYQLACLFVSAQRSKKNTIVPADPYVQLTIRAIQAFLKPAARVLFKMTNQKQFNTMLYGTILKKSPITMLLLSFAINGLNRQQLKLEAPYLDPDIYFLYKKIFFDLEGIVAIHSWMEHFLFQPAKLEGSSGVLRNRLLSYYGTFELSKEANLTGRLHKKTSKVLLLMGKNLRMKKIFDYMVTTSHLDRLHYADILLTTVKTIDEQAFTEKMKDKDLLGSQSLADLAKGIELGVRAFTQAEIESANTAGLDFSNQYTTTILNKGRLNE